MKLRPYFKFSTIASLALWISIAEAQVTVITAGKLVDPETGTARSNQILVIEDGVIREVGENPTIPADAIKLDLSSLTVLPGLFDCHTHLGIAYLDYYTGGFTLYNIEVPTAERAILSLLNAQSMLEAGFTTIRDLGNAGNWADAALLRFLSAPPVTDMGQVADFAKPSPGQIDRVLGPTLFISGKEISVFGGQFRVNPDFPNVGLQDYFYADTRDEMRKAIRQNLHYGATWIKIIIDDYNYVFSVEDIQFMVEEARTAGVRVAAHAVTERGARLAIEGGVDSIEHGYAMSDEALELAKQKGIVLVGTEHALGPDRYNIERHLSAYERDLDRLKRAHRIGVEMVYGSDILRRTPGFSRGQVSIWAIDTWAAAGIPPNEILQAMTTKPARLLGVENQRGGIRPGMAADLIGTPENPLEDIQALKLVSFVMKDGIVFRRD